MTIQIDTHITLDDLKCERGKLWRILRSLNALGDEVSPVMWERAHARLIAFEKADIEMYGSMARDGSELLEYFYELWEPPDGHHFNVYPDEDDEDLPEDPDAPPAPAPLVVIPPNSAPPNRYGGGGYEGVALNEAVNDGRLPFREDGVTIEAPPYSRTGVPSGRPWRGTRDPDKAGQRLLELCPGLTVDELRSCLGRGRKSPQARAIYVRLAAAVRELSAGHRASHKAMATFLQCGVRTVDRLASS